MFFVFDDGKNKIEGMSREQIMAAIAQATGTTPTDADSGYITTIKEQNANKGISLWVGKQNEYNAIENPDENTLYVVTDPNETDELRSEMESEIARLDAAISAGAGWEDVTDKVEIAPDSYNDSSDDSHWCEIRNKKFYYNSMLGIMIFRLKAFTRSTEDDYEFDYKLVQTNYMPIKKALSSETSTNFYSTISNGEAYDTSGKDCSFSLEVYKTSATNQAEYDYKVKGMYPGSIILHGWYLCEGALF